MAGWIKMPLGMEVGLSPGDIVLDGDPACLPKKGAEPPIFGPCLLRPTAAWVKMPLGPEVSLGPDDIVLDGGAPQFSAYVHCGQTAAWIKTPLGTEVGLGLHDIVLDGDPAPLP